MKLLTVILFAAILVSFTSKTHQGSVNQLLLPAADTFKFPEIVYKDSSGKVTIPDSLAIEMLLSFEYDIRPYNFSEFRVYRNSEEKIKEMKTRKPAPSRFFSVGDSYPLFETQDINGKQVLLKSLIGKVIVINYWFVACPPCRREMPDLNKLVADYKSDTSIVFISIATDAVDEIKKFLEKNTFNYTIIPAGRSIMGDKQVDAFPTHLVIDKKGKIAFSGIGGAPNSVYWVRKTIDELITQ